MFPSMNYFTITVGPQEICAAQNKPVGSEELGLQDPREFWFWSFCVSVVNVCLLIPAFSQSQCVSSCLLLVSELPHQFTSIDSCSSGAELGLTKLQ